jgi:hypothetical protein
MSPEITETAPNSPSARIAQNQAVQQSPFEVGQAYPEKGLPAASAQRHGRFFFFLSPGRFNAKAQAARWFQRAPPDVLGLGVITETPGFTRSSNP